MKKEHNYHFLKSKTMRITVIYLSFMLLLGSVTFANNNFGQQVLEKEISINLKDVSLKKALAKIEDLSGVKFVYSSSKLSLKENVTINFAQQKLAFVLNELLKPYSIRYSVQNEQYIVLVPNKNQDSDEEITNRVLENRIEKPQQSLILVKGKVISVPDNQSLPGVNILVKGSNKGTTSNGDGYYEILVEKDAILVFTFVGYTPEEVAVNNQTTINISLFDDIKSLSEVVVVGYGSQKKKDVTGSVTTFDTKSLEEKPIVRIEQALIGQMPGVQVRQQTGMPGEGLSILVRGSGSITAGSEPLYVIDGFPLDISSQNSSGNFTGNPLNNINANDIESIQVLKDAAAGAIYGSRAANGVVIITTKRGQVGSAKININLSTGVSRVAKKLDLLSADEWVDMATKMANINWVNSATGRTTDQSNATRRTILGLAANANNTSYMTDDRWAQPGHPGLRYLDWQDEMYRAAPYQNYEVSASGGTENVRYFISGNYLDQTGTLITSYYKNYGIRANIEANLNKKIKLGINLSPTYSIKNAPEAEGKDNQLMKMAQMVPVVEDTAGLESGAGKYATYTWGSPKLVSPVAYLNNSSNLIKSTRILGSIYGEYQIIPGLVAKSSINYDGNDQSTNKYVSDYVVVGATTERITNPGKNSSGSYGGFKLQDFVNENTLSFDKLIEGNHAISIIGGVSYHSVHKEDYLISTAGGYANDLVQTLNNAIANSSGVTYTGSTSESNNTLFSYFGRTQYAYQSKYLLSVSIRRDASSKFGKNNKWGTFPSASIGWRISKENFMANIKMINDLKLRASWGKSGNNNIGNYNSIPTLSNSNYNFGGNAPTVANGQVVSGLANPSLKWETSNTYDLGLDASIINNRISLTFDVYYKKNSDLLLNLPVLAASGFNSSLQNIGAVVNKGLELGLNTINITSNDFQWTTNANIAFNNNKVNSLGIDDAPIYISSAYSGSNAPFLLQKGLPMFSYFVTKRIGVLTAEDMADASVAKLSKETVGDAKYLDANKDGVINADDRIVGGQPTPKYTWGFTNTFKYKNFDLSIQAYGQHGGSIISYLGRAIDFSGSTTANVLGIWRNRWTSENQNYNAPRGKFGSTYTPPYVTSDWIYSTDFWRIQNITLGYNLKKITKNSRINSARVYISLQNWFSKDKYTGGVNPEAQNTNVSGNGSYALPGDYGAMPLSKTFNIGVNLTL